MRTVIKSPRGGIISSLERSHIRAVGEVGFNVEDLLLSCKLRVGAWPFRMHLHPYCLVMSARCLNENRHDKHDHDDAEQPPGGCPTAA